jgi:hypothetical protein
LKDYIKDYGMGKANVPNGKDILNLGRIMKGKRPSGRPKHTQQINIKKDLKQTGCQDVDRIHIA